MPQPHGLLSRDRADAPEIAKNAWQEGIGRAAPDGYHATANRREHESGHAPRNAVLPAGRWSIMAIFWYVLSVSTTPSEPNCPDEIVADFP